MRSLPARQASSATPTTPLPHPPEAHICSDLTAPVPFTPSRSSSSLNIVSAQAVVASVSRLLQHYNDLSQELATMRHATETRVAAVEASVAAIRVEAHDSTTRLQTLQDSIDRLTALVAGRAPLPTPH